MKQGQFPAVLSLASLDGHIGFKVDGEVAGDLSGYSLAALGDFNDDGVDDFIIGAPFYKNSVGRSYVIFGGKGIGNDGLILLSNLNGFNGFKLDGEIASDGSGISVYSGGDINIDGVADLFIGAPGHNIVAGRSYLVFGGANVGSSGLISLSQLSPKEGFKIDGENEYSDSGWPVTAMSDMNGDGYTDLLIGAVCYNNCVGRSYVVFGGPQMSNIGSFMLASLNGTNGFKIDGESVGDYSGYYLSTGDINGDYHSDLLIGARVRNNDTGCSYVIFGKAQGSNNALLSLSELDGVNGFKLNGEQIGDQSGFSLSVTDDIVDFNGDGYADFLIGSPGYNVTGRSYLIFGGDKVGENGLLSLSDLNGTTGFKIDGEIVGDGSGITAAIGDVNGDGYGDLLIGALGHNRGTGRSYVVFGGPEVGSSGLLSLSELNGSNGFKIDGENISDNSGAMVSRAGDINNDGVSDFLIAATNYNNGVGRTYVIFGDVPPVLVNNSLFLHSNETVILGGFDLAAYDLNHDNSTLLFVPTNISHGWFEVVNNPGIMLGNFTQQQILAGTIQFVYDGSNEVPSYNITVRSTGIALTGPFLANTILLKNNQLRINQGEVVPLTTDNLSADSNRGSDSELDFLIGNLQHGRFEYIDKPGDAILSFQQQDVINQQVSFIHDGSDLAPTYAIAIRDGDITTSFQSAFIDFATPPKLEHAFLKISPPDNFLLSSTNLQAEDDRVPAGELIFEMSEVVNGYFAYTFDWFTPIFNFTQQAISEDQIYFIADSDQPPAFKVSVWNGRMYCNGCPQIAQVIIPESDTISSGSFNLMKGLISLLAIPGVVPIARYLLDKIYKYYFSRHEHGLDAEITNAILEQLWIGYCGIFTRAQHAQYIQAVTRIVDELDIRGTWGNKTFAQQTEIKSQIAQAAKTELVGRSFCVTRFFKSLLCSEATPHDIETKVVAIGNRALPHIALL